MAETTGAVVDFDLRVILRMMPAPELGLHIQRGERILQWRKRHAYPNSGWTEWQDVPFVGYAEGSAAREPSQEG